MHDRDANLVQTVGNFEKRVVLDDLCVYGTIIFKLILKHCTHLAQDREQ
jgi:hypothetical protein